MKLRIANFALTPLLLHMKKLSIGQRKIQKNQEKFAKAHIKYLYLIAQNVKMNIHQRSTTLLEVNGNCLKKKTQTAIFNFINERFPGGYVQEGCVDWCKNKETGKHLPFDIYGDEITEVDGDQHFEEHFHFKGDIEERIKRDVYKMKQANIEGKRGVIRIVQRDVWDAICGKLNWDWKKAWLDAKKDIMDNKAKNIIKNVFICRNNEYERHEQHLK